MRRVVQVALLSIVGDEESRQLTSVSESIESAGRRGDN